MKRQKKIKNIKIKWPPLTENFKDYLVKRLSVLIGALMLFAVIALTMNAILHKSAYFRVKAVEIKDALIDKTLVISLSGDLLKSYKGKNIFDIDIKELSGSLGAVYPEARRLAVKRVLPDKIVINLNLKRPIAIIGNANPHPVDDEGYLLPNIDARYLKDLPTVTGVSIGGEEKRTRRSESRNLRVAIELIKAIKEAKFLSGYGVATVDASNIKDLSFYLRNGLEVKIGCENLKERLGVLRATLRDPRLVLEKIKYIDVRFENVIIGPSE